jgi:type II secretory pathway component GspD/PulD (secretin)
MTVSPEVKGDGYIVAKVEPTVSNLVDLVNNQYPRTTERSITSTMRVKDGDTIVLGGLISENQRHSVSKIPLLGDLPIFGPLFRSITDSADRNEVILMMTPHIMD